MGIVIIILSVACAVWGLYLVWDAGSRIFSRYMKVKKERVEIIQVPYKDQMMSSGQKATVQLIDRKRKRRKTLIMSPKGLGVGDVGLLEYQGRFGLSFTAEGSAVKDKRSHYYDFNWHREEEKKKVTKERKKRKYW